MRDGACVSLLFYDQLSVTFSSSQISYRKERGGSFSNNHNIHTTIKANQIY
jgi:hypothetical protein